MRSVENGRCEPAYLDGVSTSSTSMSSSFVVVVGARSLYLAQASLKLTRVDLLSQPP